MKKSKEELVLEKFGYIVYSISSTYFNLPTFMDQEDLNRIGEKLLTDMIVKHGHLSEKDFERYFRTSLKNKFNTLVSFHRAQRRDMRKVISHDAPIGEDNEGGEIKLDISDKPRSGSKDVTSGSSQRELLPPDALILKETLETLRAKLSADEIKVLDLFLNSPEILHEEFEKSLKSSGKAYHTRLPFYVIHNALGWEKEEYTKLVLKSFKLKLLEHLEMYDLMIELFPEEFPPDPKESLGEKEKS